MKTFFADLHIHTGLSPCAAEEMTPPAIVAAAVRAGLGLIAICDHNAAANTGATLLAGEGRIAVLAGIEITTAEEVHVLGLFPGPISALAAAEEVLETLPVGDAAYRRRFGVQRVINADGQTTAYEDRMLAVASRLDLDATVALVHRHSGVAIAAHINRPSFSVLSQLGVFPAQAGFDAVEIFAPSNGRRAASSKGSALPHQPDGSSASAITRRNVQWGVPESTAVLSSSDSHFLHDIGSSRTALRMQDATFDEFVLALRGEDGRGVERA